MKFLTDGATIKFPNIGIEEITVKDGFSVFGFEIKFYALIIAAGLLLAAIYALRRCKQYGLTTDDILDILLVGVPCAVVGARAYYVLCRWDAYFVNPEHWYDFLNIRGGGLAIYGGVIGAVVGLMIFYLSKKSRRKKLLPAFDIGGIGLLIGQGIGRWGNFINREAFGGYTDNLFAMQISVQDFRNSINADTPVEVKQFILDRSVDGFVQVHPTFFYESAWNLAGVALLHFLSKKRKFDGQVFLYYIAWYGLGRAWIEGLRLDSLGAGSFRISQVLAAVTCVASLSLLAYVLIKKKPDGSKLLVNMPAEETAEAPAQEQKEEI